LARTRVRSTGMADPISIAQDHDPDLTGFLEDVLELSAERHLRGPDAFLAAIEGLAEQFRALRLYRNEKSIEQRFESFADKRFQLIDEPEEYALAGDEVLVLSMALGDSAPVSVPALKRAMIHLSAVLKEENVPTVFGHLLKRLRQLARQYQDKELEAWVLGVVKSLPSE
jgi:hypothetical protein